jgi:SLT domain-containing protein
MANIGKTLSAAGLEELGKQADTIGKIADTASKMVSALTALSNYKTIASDIISSFMVDLGTLVRSFVASSKQFDAKAVEGAAIYSDSVGKMVAIVANGVSGLTSLQSYGHIANEATDVFFRDLNNLSIDFVESAGWFDSDGLAAAAAFADSTGKMVAILTSGVQGFASLATYQSVPQKVIGSFVNDLAVAVALAGQASAKMKGDMLTQVDNFTTSAGNIVNQFKSAMELFKALTDFKGVPSTAIKELSTEIDYTVGLATSMSQKANSDLVSQAVKFSDAIVRISAGFKSALDLFSSLGNYRFVSAQQINMLSDAVNLAVQLMGNVDNSSFQFRNAANIFQQNMTAGFAAIQVAISAALGTSQQVASTIASINALPPKLPGMATGGTVLGQGLALVGESGPELAMLPAGTQVFNNDQTSRMLQGSFASTSSMLPNLRTDPSNNNTVYIAEGAVVQHIASGADANTVRIARKEVETALAKLGPQVKLSKAASGKN